MMAAPESGLLNVLQCPVRSRVDESTIIKLAAHIQQAAPDASSLAGMVEEMQETHKRHTHDISLLKEHDFQDVQQQKQHHSKRVLKH